MFNLKNNKKVGLLLTMMIMGVSTVGCSEDVSAIDPSNIKDTKPAVEKTVDDKKEDKQEVKKEEEKDTSVTASEAQEIIRGILGDNEWETKETINSNGKDLYVIQRIGTDADFRFLVDKKTGEAFCESSINVGNYHPIKTIEDVDEYLANVSSIVNGNMGDEGSNGPDYGCDASNLQDESDDKASDGISAEEAKAIIRDEYYGLDVQEPIKTTYQGKDVWSVEHKTEVDGQSYTHILYVDCATGEVYSAY